MKECCYRPGEVVKVFKGGGDVTKSV
jgi:hypothetical protein